MKSLHDFNQNFLTEDLDRMRIAEPVPIVSSGAPIPPQSGFQKIPPSLPSPEYIAKASISPPPVAPQVAAPQVAAPIQASALPPAHIARPLSPPPVAPSPEGDAVIGPVFQTTAEDDSVIEPVFRLPAEEAAAPPKGKRKKKEYTFLTFLSDLLFYMAVLLVLFSVFTSGADSGTPRTLFGYSYFTVMSRSMQDEIPKGAFILVKKTEDLDVGDNITYMRDQSTTVTHKIMEIIDNYQDSGSRGFVTKGVNNMIVDTSVVFEENVVGKVILVMPKAGATISLIASNLHYVIILFVLCIVFSFSIRGLFVKPSKKGEAGAANSAKSTGSAKSSRSAESAGSAGATANA